MVYLGSSYINTTFSRGRLAGLDKTDPFVAINMGNDDEPPAIRVSGGPDSNLGRLDVQVPARLSPPTTLCQPGAMFTPSMSTRFSHRS